MPVPSGPYDLSPVAGANSPASTESPRGVIDDYFRAAFASIALLQAERSIASASTVDMSGVNESAVEITGTTGIVSFGTVRAGIWKLVRFSGALTLTHNASTFILPGAANITTVAGDTALFLSHGAGVWRCYVYNRASGTWVGAVTSYQSVNTTTTNHGTDATGGYAQTIGAYSYRINTNGASRFWVDSNGRAAFATASLGSVGGTAARVIVQYDSSAENGITLQTTSGSSTGSLVAFYNSGGTVVGSISTNGTTTTYNTSSDARLKTDIRPAGNVGDKLDAIEVCTYRWRETGEAGFGVIAQQLREAIPEAVSEGAFLGVDYSKIVPYLVREVQSLRARLAAAGL